MTATTQTYVVHRAGAPIRPVLLAPFGHYTRYLLRSYLVHIFIVTAALLSVSLTFDLSPWLWKVFNRGGGGDTVAALARLGWFILLRATDILAQLVPITVFLGVLWSEIALTWSRERLMIANTGRSPMQCLAPVAILAVAMLLIQFALDSYLRPAAVMTLAHERLGEYGQNYDRGLTRHRLWLAAGDDVVRARVRFGPPPALRDVTVYRISPDDRIDEVISASTAVPIDIMGRSLWLFYDASRWGGGAGAESRGHDNRFTRHIAALSLDTVWLAYYGIHAKYLPRPVLERLAAQDEATYPASQYRTWVQARYAQAFLPGGLALLATSLSLLLMATETPFLAVLLIATAGYMATVLMKLATIFGEHGLLGPVAATWPVPLALFIASGLVLRRVWARRRGLPRGRAGA